MMRALLWLALGAAGMYILDPEQGRRRRKQVRARLTQRMRREAAPRSPELEGQAPRETPAGAHHLGR